jgi:hypothetical protein
LICDAAVEEDTCIAQQIGEVIVELFVGNHVRVAAVSVGGNIDRKHYPSHRSPHTTLIQKIGHRLIELPSTENGGDALGHET